MEQNHYKLIKLLTKEKILKVHNYKKNQIEVYSLDSDKETSVLGNSFKSPELTKDYKKNLEKQQNLFKASVRNIEYVTKKKEKKLKKIKKLFYLKLYLVCIISIKIIRLFRIMIFFLITCQLNFLKNMVNQI